MTSDGYILTNNHVVDGADKIHIDLSDGRTLEAKVVGTDKPSDLALVKVDATGLQTAPLGNSDNVQVGDVVLAIGNPLGIGQTVTMGIVSARAGRPDRAMATATAATRTSCRPTRRSTTATPAARW